MNVQSAAVEPVELEETEHLLLWAVRVMAVGHGECPALRRAFQDLCGPLADQALTSLFVAVKQFAWRGLRPLRLHAPGCSLLSRDEQALLAAFATAQASSQNLSHLEDQLTLILGRAPDPVVCSAVQMTAALLSRGGRQLPLRDPRSPGRIQSVEAPMAFTLH